MLAGCLDSVAGAVDEIIIVDTGSRDKTIEMALAAGAKVLEQAWDDDFSAPRNRSIQEATGDWVLVLDADERLAPGAAQRLRAVVARDDFDCGLLPLHNAKQVDSDPLAVVSGAERLADAAYLPRLLRRTEDLRFTGIIHENVGDWLHGGGRKPAFIKGLDIVHLGGVPSLRERREKTQRNIRLLERYLTRAPNDITPYGYLAHEYLEAGRREEGAQTAERGWEILESGVATVDLSALRLTTARAWVKVQSGDAQAGLDTVARGLSLVPGHPDLYFIRGCAHEMLGVQSATASERSSRYEQALLCYEQALSKDGQLFLQKFVQGCTGWAAWVRCGTIHMLNGRYDKAQAAFLQCLALNDDNKEARWGQAECALARGQVTEAMRLVHGVLDERPDGWVLAALGAEAGGLLEQMMALVSKAQQCLPKGFIAPHRRERYHDAVALLSMYNGTPGEAPGPLGQLALLMQSRYEAVAGARLRPLDEAMVRRVLRHLLLHGQTQWLLPLLDGRSEALLPGIGALTQQTIQGLGAELQQQGKDG